MQKQKTNQADKTNTLNKTDHQNTSAINTTQIEKKDKGAEFISERRNKLQKYVDEIDEAFMENKGQEDPYQFIDKKL
jgi:hypothetical protein